jgi:DNA-binding CsgD family transcriptional regulator
MFLLEPVGLGKVENDVYLTLLDLRRGTDTEVGARLSLPLSAVREALSRLLDNGLIQQLDTDATTFAVAAPQDALAALVHRKRGDLARMQVRIEEIAERLRTDQHGAGGSLVELLEGEDAIITAISTIQVNARKEIMGIDAPPYIDGQSLNQVELSQLARGISYRFIYTPEALTRRPECLTTMRQCVEAGEEARILPGATMKMVIADRTVAMLPASYENPDPTVRILVHSKALVDLLVWVWETLWARATPVDQDAGPVAGLAARDKELLSLLAAGLKDRSIARAMGVAERTVGRRLIELMNELGVETRFQAGVQAARRGWL